MIAAILAFSSDTNTFLIAIMIPILGILGPWIMARQINRNARAVKEQDWERQDLVAERVAKAVEDAAKSAQIVSERQIVIDQKTNHVVSQVEKIHGLVNSQMTEVLRSELAATRDTLALMGELIDNHRKSGIEPTMHVLSAFKGRESKVAELEETIRAREEADEASKLINTGPQEVVIVNPDPVPVVESPLTPEEAKEVIVTNPNPIPVIDVPVVEDEKT